MLRESEANRIVPFTSCCYAWTSLSPEQYSLQFHLYSKRRTVITSIMHFLKQLIDILLELHLFSPDVTKIDLQSLPSWSKTAFLPSLLNFVAFVRYNHQLFGIRATNSSLNNCPSVSNATYRKGDEKASSTVRKLGCYSGDVPAIRET